MKSVKRVPPLTGVRIIDLGVATAIPYAMRTLALLGAEVIQVESTQRPDITRFGTQVNNENKGEFWNRSGRYNYSNTNKKSLTLDLTRPEGQEIIRRLIGLADVVAENWSPKVKRKLGLTYEEQRKIKPDIIVISANGYGENGPWADWLAWGMALDGVSGIAYLTGYPDGPPVKGSPPITDWISETYSTISALAALEYRNKTGRGQWINVSEMAAAVPHVGEAVMDYTMNGRVQTRIGNHHRFMAPHSCYRCKGNDKWVAIAVPEDKWDSFCTALGDPSWTREERFATALSRWQNQDELDKLVEQWTLCRGHYEAMEQLQQAGIPAGAVLNIKEVLLDPHQKARGCYQLTTHSEREGIRDLGTRPYLGLRWKMSKTPVMPVEPAPTLGQDNYYILHDLLHLPEEEIDALKAKGIIGTKPAAAVDVGGFSTVPIPTMLDRGQITEYDPDFMEILGLKKTGP